MNIYTGEMATTATYDEYRVWVMVEDEAGLRLTVVQEGTRGRADVTAYAVREVPTLRGLRKFELRNGPTGTHHVTLGPRACCTCDGFRRHRHCKHLDATRAAATAGALDGGHDTAAMTAAWGPGPAESVQNSVD